MITVARLDGITESREVPLVRQPIFSKFAAIPFHAASIGSAMTAARPVLNGRA